MAFDKTVIFGLLFLHGCMRAFLGPAQQGMLPTIVSQAEIANAVAVTSMV